MNNSNSIVLKAFNKHLFEFIDDVVIIFPENKHIVDSRDMMLSLKKANPSLLIKLWKKYIWGPYEKEISEGNIDFFIEKDYTEDFRNLPNGPTVSTAIDNTIRGPMREMDSTNRIHCIKHLQIVSQLSGKYVVTN